MKFTEKWVDVKVNTLRQENQTQKDKYCMLSLVCRS